MRMSKGMVCLVTLPFGLLLVSCSPFRSEAISSPSASASLIVKKSEPKCQPLRDKTNELEQSSLKVRLEAIGLEGRMLIAKVKELAASGRITEGDMREITKLQTLGKMQIARLKLPLPKSKIEIAKWSKANLNLTISTVSQQLKVDDLITVFFYHGYLKPFLFPEVVQLGLQGLDMENERFGIITSNPKCFTDAELDLAKILRDGAKGWHGQWASKQSATNLRDFL